MLRNWIKSSLVVNRIVVEDHQVIIEHVVPTGPVRLQTEQQLPATLTTEIFGRVSLICG